MFSRVHTLASKIRSQVISKYHVLLRRCRRPKDQISSVDSSQLSSPLPSLPVELLELIFLECARCFRDSIWSLSLVSKTVSEWVLPVLYNPIYIKPLSVYRSGLPVLRPHLVTSLIVQVEEDLNSAIAMQMGPWLGLFPRLESLALSLHNENESIWETRRFRFSNAGHGNTPRTVSLRFRSYRPYYEWPREFRGNLLKDTVCLSINQSLALALYLCNENLANELLALQHVLIEVENGVNDLHLCVGHFTSIQHVRKCVVAYSEGGTFRSEMLRWESCDMDKVLFLPVATKRIGWSFLPDHFAWLDDVWKRSQ
ncbi:hypothetical protein DL96DRAFT_1589611 [Flagelloscypha sp. PMI_526]|nr:hypothetical protein DL96DRAFT_1589611 [Flagelloscypha sp. PMI_526]